MENARAYNKTFFLIAATAIAAAVFLNVTLDIHRVFGVCGWNRKYLDEDVGFLKIKYLKTHRDYDAFVVGSSRANYLDARMASELSGHRYYSLAEPAEKIDRISRTMQWVVREGIPVKQVIVCLDFDTLFLSPDLSDSILSTKAHPEVTGESWIDFYPSYLFQFDGRDYKKFLKRTPPGYWTKNFRLDVVSGHWFLPDWDRQIAQDPEKYLKETFYQTTYERGQGRIPVNLERLKALLGFLDAQGIRRIVVINPCNYSLFKTFDRREYRQWIRAVTMICGRVWDFSGPNAVTRDDHLYYETSHFRWPVGDEVLKVIFGAPDARKDFGVLLKKEDVSWDPA
ncbi:MAG: hypothetical protein ACM3L6_06615 [Deltaproteobacteria bacterium]